MAKRIVITGAGVGLGRRLALRFAADGDTVILLGRTGAKVEAVAAEIGERAMALECDVSSPQSVRSAFAAIAERFDAIDVLINNAALFEPFKLAAASDEQILAGITTNVCGPMFCSRSAIPMMARGAHIINISSESISLPLPHFTIYQSSKAAVETFSEKLASELEPEGIRVTAVRCGKMYEEGKQWDIPREAAIAFHEECMKRGINPREQPISQFSSMESIFRTLIDLPADVHLDFVSACARYPQ